ncbi:MAG: hypothetical protein ACWIPH_06060 [Ostreibacterium sp.]
MTNKKVDTQRVQSVSDQQLVDYILQLCTLEVYQQLTALIKGDDILRTRLLYWEAALFSLHTATAPVAPSPAVWEKIENSLFTEQSSVSEKKRGFFSYLIPAFFSLCLLFVATFYFMHQPTYGANVIADNQQMLWEINGNEKNIDFVSINDVSMPNMKCVAWLIKSGTPPIMIGEIPDTGNNEDMRITLPQSLKTNLGDKIIIIMVGKNNNSKRMPANPKMFYEVTLTKV